MELNMTAIQGLNGGQAFNTVYSQITIPIIISMFILALLIFAAGGLFVSGKNSKSRYYGIWFLGVVVLAIISVILIYCPHFVFDKLLGWL